MVHYHKEFLTKEKKYWTLTTRFWSNAETRTSVEDDEKCVTFSHRMPSSQQLRKYFFYKSPTFSPDTQNSLHNKYIQSNIPLTRHGSAFNKWSVHKTRTTKQTRRVFLFSIITRNFSVNSRQFRFQRLTTTTGGHSTREKQLSRVVVKVHQQTNKRKVVPLLG
jgi:hypothetical protein